MALAFIVLVALQWFGGPDTLPLLLAYLARLIWSHLPLLYYTHCVMVEDGIWKKIWLIRHRVYDESEMSLLVTPKFLHLRVEIDHRS